jgi:transcriptional regulator with XRE-family HTH domain
MENNILTLFGQNLVKVRKELGWSQEQLAIASGIGRSYMSGIERGRRNLGLLNICKLAETMGIKPSMLMDF